MIVATPVLNNFARGRNNPIEEEPLGDHDESPVTALDNLSRPLGKATGRALTIQHFR